jgi:energy-coupling factor transport system permease protein
VSQPAVLLVACAGSAVLLWRTPGPGWPALLVGLSGIVTFTLINPFVSVEGNTVIFSFGHFPHALLDGEVTVEELVYGAHAGMQLATVTFATAIFVLRCDPDRLTGLAGRVAPRSALAVALAARLVPTLSRDGARLADAARARGLALDAGSRRSRARARSLLVAPLLATGLERGLETAEAMTARGYGSAARTQLPSGAPPAVQRLLYAPALALAAVAVAMLLAGVASFRYYETLGPPARPSVLVGAGATALALLAAGLVLERWTRSQS